MEVPVVVGEGEGFNVGILVLLADGNGLTEEVAETEGTMVGSTDGVAEGLGHVFAHITDIELLPVTSGFRRHWFGVNIALFGQLLQKVSVQKLIFAVGKSLFPFVGEEDNVLIIKLDPALVPPT